MSHLFSTNNTWFRAALFCAFSIGLFAQSASARISGTIFGQISAIDTRGQGCDENTPDLAHCFHIGDLSGTGRTVPLPNVLIRAYVRPAIATSPAQYIYTKTEPNGGFQFDWDDVSRSSFPATIYITVMMERPIHNSFFESSDRPYYRFRVAGGRGESFSTTARYTVNSSLKFVSRTINITETVDAYLTANEVFDRVIDGNNAAPLFRATPRLLGANVNGVGVWTRQPRATPTQVWGFTPTAYNIFLATGTPRRSPWTVAHEFGHLVHWRALGVDIAYPDLATNYQACDGPGALRPPAGIGAPGVGWSRDDRECERTASIEGFADFIASAWMWSRGAETPSSPRGMTALPGSSSLSIEDTDTRLCALPSAQQFAWCHTQYFWDIFDSNGDDDGTTNLATGARIDDISRMTIEEITLTWGSFRDWCWHPWLDVDNGCTNEGGVSALNHLDFERNWPFQNGGDLRAIMIANGVGGGIVED